MSLFENDTQSFKVGDGETLPCLEAAVLGMKLGETKEVMVQPTDPGHPAPQPYDSSLVVEVDQSQLPPDGHAIGSTLLIGAERRCATLTSIDQESGKATLDMNDPLCGQDLVLAVRLVAFDVHVEQPKVNFSVPSGVPDRDFTLKEVNAHDGSRSRVVYLAIRGYVYDVSEGYDFYGPGGSYAVLGGRDGTVALSKMSTDPSDVDTPWEGEGVLTREQEKVLAHWISTFNSKYPVIGRLKHDYSQTARL